MTVDELIAEALGSPLKSSEALGGGCIASTRLAGLADGRQVVIKTGATTFLEEAAGLRELQKADAIRIPDVLFVQEEVLVLEAIPSGEPGADFMECFGRQFAALHRVRAAAHGFYADNFIGASAQRNTPCCEDWAAFYWQQRLAVQLRLAEQKGLADAALRTAMHHLEARLPDLLAGTEEQPSLLHGDLWNGNFLVGPAGEAVLIDPAVYYGHREADLGMTHLFGGFSARFYDAYEEAWPLPDGHQDRVGLYMLYHVLNHLNLFGRSYLGQAVQLARRYS